MHLSLVGSGVAQNGQPYFPGGCQPLPRAHIPAGRPTVGTCWVTVAAGEAPSHPRGQQDRGTAGQTLALLALSLVDILLHLNIFSKVGV